MMADENTVSRNESFTIQELSDLVRAGRIRVPEFQRSFRWDASDVLALFDSILRGYPFGSFLLWRRDAPAAELTIGALLVDAVARPDALWVVDGQQRITSLVNAVDPQAAADARFRILYSLQRRQVLSSREARNDLAIPLPDLFDFGRALGWLHDNPDAADHAEEVQRVAGLLNKVEVAAAVIERGDEHVLRDVFDRINSRGKRLNAAEIFDAIHSSGGQGSGEGVSLGSIANRIDHATDFGLLDSNIVVQALLVRRHPDITRDVHVEFAPNRAAEGAFPGESEVEAYRNTELALLSAIRYLQETIEIPHFSFLPFRFHLLVLVRFFALFEDPSPRNLELLSRWFWRSSVAAGPLGLTGSTGNVRSMAAHVRPGDESGSVQRLLIATETNSPLPIPDVDVFRTNQSSGKVILAALWALSPNDPESNDPLSRTDLVRMLEGDTSPAAVAIEMFPRASLGKSGGSAANRAISTLGRQEFIGGLSSETDLESLLLDDELLELLNTDQREAFISRRAERLSAYLADFLEDRTGVGLEATPPLEDFDFDQDIDDEDVS